MIIKMNDQWENEAKEYSIKRSQEAINDIRNYCLYPKKFKEELKNAIALIENKKAKEKELNDKNELDKIKKATDELESIKNTIKSNEYITNKYAIYKKYTDQDKFFESHYKGNLPDEIVGLDKFLMKLSENIMFENEEKIRGTIEYFIEIFKEEEIRQFITSILALYFDYDSDSFDKMFIWKESKKYQFCPYCQISSLIISDEKNNGNEKYRPPFDHYYPKALYPFLSLSVMNLVPTCDRCNKAPLKGDTDFYKIIHLHPIFDDECIKFSMNLAKIITKDVIGNTKTPEIYKLIPTTVSLENTIQSLSEKYNNSIATFKINERYNTKEDGAPNHAIRDYCDTTIKDCRDFENRIAFYQHMKDKYFQSSILLAPPAPLKFKYANTEKGKLKYDIFQEISAIFFPLTSEEENKLEFI